jgi:hypothetical protein
MSRLLLALVCAIGAFSAAQLLDPALTFALVLTLAALGLGWALSPRRLLEGVR